MLEAFSHQVSLKRGDIREAAQKKLGEDIPQAVYSKVLKELSYCKNISWIFKSGNGTEG